MATLCVGIIFYKYDYGLIVFYSGFIKSVKQIANTYTFYIVNPGLFAGRRSTVYIFYNKKIPNIGDIFWCRMSDLNQRPTDYKSAALPTELIRQRALLYIVGTRISSQKIHNLLAKCNFVRKI